MWDFKTKMLNVIKTSGVCLSTMLLAAYLTCLEPDVLGGGKGIQTSDIMYRLSSIDLQTAHRKAMEGLSLQRERGRGTWRDKNVLVNFYKSECEGDFVPLLHHHAKLKYM